MTDALGRLTDGIVGLLSKNFSIIPRPNNCNRFDKAKRLPVPLVLGHWPDCDAAGFAPGIREMTKNLWTPLTADSIWSWTTAVSSATNRRYRNFKRPT